MKNYHPSSQLDIHKIESKNPRRVAIQGYAGAFHDLAAHHFWSAEPLDLLPCNTFKRLVESVESGQAERGLMAIENSIAGSLLSNYLLLAASDLVITGEVFLRIKQNLLAVRGSRLEDIEEVRSHPVALAQCADFFEKYPKIKLVEAIDTALAAHEIQLESSSRLAAVASLRAAELYDLDVLAEEIETNHRNFTRFLALEKRAAAQPPSHAACKISLVFEIPHAIGSLHQVLASLAAHRCNLTKIQSVPLVGNEWHYLFFIDFLLENTALTDHLLTILESLTENLRVLGRYPEGQYFE